MAASMSPDSSSASPRLLSSSASPRMMPQRLLVDADRRGRLAPAAHEAAEIEHRFGVRGIDGERPSGTPPRRPERRRVARAERATGNAAARRSCPPRPARAARGRAASTWRRHRERAPAPCGRSLRRPRGARAPAVPVRAKRWKGAWSGSTAIARSQASSAPEYSLRARATSASRCHASGWIGSTPWTARAARSAAGRSLRPNASRPCAISSRGSECWPRRRARPHRARRGIPCSAARCRRGTARCAMPEGFIFDLPVRFRPLPRAGGTHRHASHATVAGYSSE